MPALRRMLRCPVGKEPLGYFVPGETCSFVCSDCRYIFSWNPKGILLAPIKLTRQPEKCGCGVCRDRDGR